MQTVYNRPNRPFHIVPYDPAWSDTFNRLAKEIEKLLGSEVVRIEHIGSTSVPGMVAKPQIDILVEVNELTRVRNYYQTMQAKGYIPKGDYALIGEEFFAKDLPDGSRLASAHVLPTGHPNIRLNLKFRDYLKHHPNEIAAYSTAKQSAYDQSNGDYNAYFKAKSPYVKALVKRANAWSGH